MAFEFSPITPDSGRSDATPNYSVSPLAGEAFGGTGPSDTRQNTGFIPTDPDAYVTLLDGRTLSRGQLIGLSNGSELLDLMDRNKEGRRGFMEAVTDVDRMKGDLPFVGDVMGVLMPIKDIIGVNGTFKRLNAGEQVSDQEMLNAQLFIEDQKRMSEASTGGMVGEVLRAMPMFAAEIGASMWLGGKIGAAVGGTAGGGAGAVPGAGVGMLTGLAAGTRRGAVKGLRYVTKKIISEAAQDKVGKFLASKAGSAIARRAVGVADGLVYAGFAGTAMTALDTTINAAANAAQGLPGGMSRGAAERFAAAGFTGDDTSIEQAQMLAIGDKWVEYVSEMSGGAFTAALGEASTAKVLMRALDKVFGAERVALAAKGVKVAAPTGASRLVRAKFAALGAIASVTDRLAKDGDLEGLVKRLGQVGYDGYMEEILEERFGGALRGLLGIEGEGPGIRNAIDQAIPDKEQLKVEMIAFAVPMIATISAKRAHMAVHGTYTSVKQEHIKTALEASRTTPNSNVIELDAGGVPAPEAGRDPTVTVDKGTDAIEIMADEARDRAVTPLARIADVFIEAGHLLVTGHLSGLASLSGVDTMLSTYGRPAMIGIYNKAYNGVYGRLKEENQGAPKTKQLDDETMRKMARTEARETTKDFLGSLRKTLVLRKSILGVIGGREGMPPEELATKINDAYKKGQIRKISYDNGRHELWTLADSGDPVAEGISAFTTTMREVMARHGHPVDEVELNTMEEARKHGLGITRAFDIPVPLDELRGMASNASGFRASLLAGLNHLPGFGHNPKVAKALRAHASRISAMHDKGDFGELWEKVDSDGRLVSRIRVRRHPGGIRVHVTDALTEEGNDETNERIRTASRVDAGVLRDSVMGAADPAAELQKALIARSFVRRDADVVRYSTHQLIVTSDPRILAASLYDLMDPAEAADEGKTPDEIAAAKQTAAELLTGYFGRDIRSDDGKFRVNVGNLNTTSEIMISPSLDTYHAWEEITEQLLKQDNELDRGKYGVYHPSVRHMQAVLSKYLFAKLKEKGHTRTEREELFTLYKFVRKNPSDMAVRVLATLFLGAGQRNSEYNVHPVPLADVIRRLRDDILGEDMRDVTLPFAEYMFKLLGIQDAKGNLNKELFAHNSSPLLDEADVEANRLMFENFRKGARLAQVVVAQAPTPKATPVATPAAAPASRAPAKEKAAAPDTKINAEEAAAAEEERFREAQIKKNVEKRESKSRELSAFLRDEGISLDSDILLDSDGITYVEYVGKDDDGFVQVQLERHMREGTMQSRLVTVKPGDTITAEMDDRKAGTTRYAEAQAAFMERVTKKKKKAAAPAPKAPPVKPVARTPVGGKSLDYSNLPAGVDLDQTPKVKTPPAPAVKPAVKPKPKARVVKSQAPVARSPVPVVTPEEAQLGIPPPPEVGAPEFKISRSPEAKVATPAPGPVGVNPDLGGDFAALNKPTPPRKKGTLSALPMQGTDTGGMAYSEIGAAPPPDRVVLDPETLRDAFNIEGAAQVFMNPAKQALTDQQRERLMGVGQDVADLILHAVSINSDLSPDLIKALSGAESAEIGDDREDETAASLQEMISGNNERSLKMLLSARRFASLVSLFTGFDGYQSLFSITHDPVSWGPMSRALETEDALGEWLKTDAADEPVETTALKAAIRIINTLSAYGPKDEKGKPLISALTLDDMRASLRAIGSMVQFQGTVMELGGNLAVRNTVSVAGSLRGIATRKREAFAADIEMFKRAVVTPYQALARAIFTAVTESPENKSKIDFASASRGILKHDIVDAALRTTPALHREVAQVLSNWTGAPKQMFMAAMAKPAGRKVVSWMIEAADMKLREKGSLLGDTYMWENFTSEILQKRISERLPGAMQSTWTGITAGMAGGGSARDYLTQMVAAAGMMDGAVAPIFDAAGKQQAGWMQTTKFTQVINQFLKEFGLRRKEATEFSRRHAGAFDPSDVVLLSAVTTAAGDEVAWNDLTEAERMLVIDQMEGKGYLYTGVYGDKTNRMFIRVSMLNAQDALARYTDWYKAAHRLVLEQAAFVPPSEIKKLVDAYGKEKNEIKRRELLRKINRPLMQGRMDELVDGDLRFYLTDARKNEPVPDYALKRVNEVGAEYLDDDGTVSSKTRAALSQHISKTLDSRFKRRGNDLTGGRTGEALEDYLAKLPGRTDGKPRVLVIKCKKLDAAVDGQMYHRIATLGRAAVQAFGQEFAGGREGAWGLKFQISHNRAEGALTIPNLVKSFSVGLEALNDEARTRPEIVALYDLADSLDIDAIVVTADEKVPTDRSYTRGMLSDDRLEIVSLDQLYDPAVVQRAEAMVRSVPGSAFIFPLTLSGAPNARGAKFGKQLLNMINSLRNSGEYQEMFDEILNLEIEDSAAGDHDALFELVVKQLDGGDPFSRDLAAGLRNGRLTLNSASVKARLRIMPALVRALQFKALRRRGPLIMAPEGKEGGTARMTSKSGRHLMNMNLQGRGLYHSTQLQGTTLAAAKADFSARFLQEYRRINKGVRLIYPGEEREVALGNFADKPGLIPMAHVFRTSRPRSVAAAVNQLGFYRESENSPRIVERGQPIIIIDGEGNIDPASMVDDVFEQRTDGSWWVLGTPGLADRIPADGLQSMDPAHLNDEFATAPGMNGIELHPAFNEAVGADGDGDAPDVYMLGARFDRSLEGRRNAFIAMLIDDYNYNPDIGEWKKHGISELTKRDQALGEKIKFGEASRIKIVPVANSLERVEYEMKVGQIGKNTVGVAAKSNTALNQFANLGGYTHDMIAVEFEDLNDDARPTIKLTIGRTEADARAIMNESLPPAMWHRMRMALHVSAQREISSSVDDAKYLTQGHMGFTNWVKALVTCGLALSNETLHPDVEDAAAFNYDAEFESAFKQASAFVHYIATHPLIHEVNRRLAEDVTRLEQKEFSPLYASQVLLKILRGALRNVKVAPQGLITGAERAAFHAYMRTKREANGGEDLAGPDYAKARDDFIRQNTSAGKLLALNDLAEAMRGVGAISDLMVADPRVRKLEDLFSFQTTLDTLTNKEAKSPLALAFPGKLDTARRLLDVIVKAAPNAYFAATPTGRQVLDNLDALMIPGDSVKVNSALGMLQTQLALRRMIEAWKGRNPSQALEHEFTTARMLKLREAHKIDIGGGRTRSNAFLDLIWTASEGFAPGMLSIAPLHAGKNGAPVSDKEAEAARQDFDRLPEQLQLEIAIAAYSLFDAATGPRNHSFTQFMGNPISSEFMKTLAGFEAEVHAEIMPEDSVNLDAAHAATQLLAGGSLYKTRTALARGLLGFSYREAVNGKGGRPGGEAEPEWMSETLGGTDVVPEDAYFGEGALELIDEVPGLSLDDGVPIAPARKTKPKREPTPLSAVTLAGQAMAESAKTPKDIAPAEAPAPVEAAPGIDLAAMAASANPPEFAAAKENAKAEAVQTIAAAKGTRALVLATVGRNLARSFANRLGRIAETAGILVTSGDQVQPGDALYASIAGRGRGLGEAQLADFITLAQTAIDKGAVLVTDSEENANRLHNARGEGRLRQALLDAGYVETPRELFSEWRSSQETGEASTDEEIEDEELSPPMEEAPAEPPVEEAPVVEPQEPAAPAPIEFSSQLDNGFKLLSNFVGGPIELDGVSYPTAEHAYQAAKFQGDKGAQGRGAVLSAATAATARKRGSQYPITTENFDAQREEIMRRILQAKLEQVPGVREALAASDNAPLVHPEPWARGEAYWGVKDGKGANTLGKLWEELRGSAAHETAAAQTAPQSVVANDIPDTYKGFDVVQEPQRPHPVHGGIPAARLVPKADGSKYISVDPAELSRQYEAHQWTAPRTPGVTALPADAFPTLADWANFVMEREVQHTNFPRVKPSEGAAYGANEDAINRAAAQALGVSERLYPEHATPSVQAVEVSPEGKVKLGFSWNLASIPERVRKQQTLEQQFKRLQVAKDEAAAFLNWAKGKTGDSVELQKQFEAEVLPELEIVKAQSEIAPYEPGGEDSLPVYERLSVNKGQGNYAEYFIRTPFPVPGQHGEFQDPNLAGWFRVREHADGTLEIQEIQSELFQKNKGGFREQVGETLPDDVEPFEEGGRYLNEYTFSNEQATFLNLMLKDQTWVPVFVNVITQWARNQGFTKVRFPTGETAARVEGHQVLADRLTNLQQERVAAKRESEMSPDAPEMAGFTADQMSENKWYRIRGGSIQKRTFAGKPEFLWHNDKLNTKETVSKNVASRLYRESMALDYANRGDAELQRIDAEINELKTQGIEKLAPIEAFYEKRVASIVNRMGAVPVTDANGNTWREVKVTKEQATPSAQALPQKFKPTMAEGSHSPAQLLSRYAYGKAFRNIAGSTGNVAEEQRRIIDKNSKVAENLGKYDTYFAAKEYLDGLKDIDPEVRSQFNLWAKSHLPTGFTLDTICDMVAVGDTPAHMQHMEQLELDIGPSAAVRRMEDHPRNRRRPTPSATLLFQHASEWYTPAEGGGAAYLTQRLVDEAKHTTRELNATKRWYVGLIQEWGLDGIIRKFEKHTFALDAEGGEAPFEMRGIKLWWARKGAKKFTAEQRKQVSLLHYAAFLGLENTKTGSGIHRKWNKEPFDVLVGLPFDATLEQMKKVLPDAIATRLFNEVKAILDANPPKGEHESHTDYQKRMRTIARALKAAKLARFQARGVASPVNLDPGKLDQPFVRHSWVPRDITLTVPSNEIEAAFNGDAKVALVAEGRQAERLTLETLINESAARLDGMFQRIISRVPWLMRGDPLFMKYHQGYATHYFGSGFLGTHEKEVESAIEEMTNAALDEAKREYNEVINSRVTALSEVTEKMFHALYTLKGIEYKDKAQALEDVRSGALEPYGIDRRATYRDIATAIQIDVVAVIRDRMASNQVTTDKLGSIDNPVTLASALAEYQKRMRKREYSPRTMPRQYKTFMEAFELGGKRPRNYGAPDAVNRYATDILLSVKTRIILNEFVHTVDSDGNLQVIPDPDLTEASEGLPELIADEVWDEVARKMAVSFNAKLDINKTSKQNVKDMLETYVRNNPRYKRVKAPFATVPAFYAYTRPAGQENIMDLAMAGGEVAGLLQHVFGEPWRDPIGILNALEHINTWMKIQSLQFSLFFPIAGQESLAALFGTDMFKKTGLPSQIELRRMIKARHPWVLQQIEKWEELGLELGGVTNPLDLPHDMMSEDIAALTGFLHKNFGSGVAKGVNSILSFSHKQTDLMFESYFNTVKLWSAMRFGHWLESQALAEGKEFNFEEAVRPYIDYLNSEIGGINWNKVAWMTPTWRRNLQLLMFSPNWSQSSVNAAGFGAFTGPLLKNYNTPEELKFIMRHRWPNMFLWVMLLPPAIMQAFAYTVGAAFGTVGDDDEYLLFNNEEGRKLHADITPLMRLFPSYKGAPTGKRRVYIRWGKQAYETQRWLEAPWQSLMNKSSQLARWGIEMATGESAGGYGWDLPFKDQGLLGWLRDKDGQFSGSRLAYTIQKFTPFSLLAWAQNPDAGPFPLIGPVSKGMSFYGATQAAMGVLDAWARSDTYNKIQGDPRIKANLETLIWDILDAAKRNGYDHKSVMKSAYGAVVKDLYANLYKAIDSNSQPEIERWSRSIIRLNGTVNNALASVRNRDRQAGIPEELSKEHQELVRQAFASP